MLQPIERFMALTDRDGDCWRWTGRLNHAGYGQFWNSGGVVRAHRWAYETFVGPAPTGAEVDHLCRNRACVNPAHLEAVSHAENSRRAAYLQQVCARGHKLPAPPESGRRVCRECANERSRKYKSKRRAMALYDAIIGGAAQ